MSAHMLEVSKQFGTSTALDRITLHIPDGQFVALLGPSGSGKTTLLRILAGLEVPDQGAAHFHGLPWTRVGFVFQHYALFQHLSVFENVAFGLKVRPWRKRPSKAEIRCRVQDLLDTVQLGWAGGRMPDQLSGGQRQRVALARTLAVNPQVLLLDEPFGALDPSLRTNLRHWLRQLHMCEGLTSVLVTQDHDEAIMMADRIVLLNQGRIEQDGTPQELCGKPATDFVRSFLARTWQSRE
jgi:sulfate transport system ATP-binding protein